MSGTLQNGQLVSFKSSDGRWLPASVKLGTDGDVMVEISKEHFPQTEGVEQSNSFCCLKAADVAGRIRA